MDKQSISIIIKIIPLITMIWIGIIICNDAVGETEINFSDIDKQNIQRLLTHEEKDGTLKGLTSDYIHPESESNWSLISGIGFIIIIDTS
jgi:hypothetical protein